MKEDAAPKAEWVRAVHDGRGTKSYEAYVALLERLGRSVADEEREGEMDDFLSDPDAMRRMASRRSLRGQYLRRMRRRENARKHDQ